MMKQRNGPRIIDHGAVLMIIKLIFYSFLLLLSSQVSLGEEILYSKNIADLVEKSDLTILSWWDYIKDFNLVILNRYEGVYKTIIINDMGTKYCQLGKKESQKIEKYVSLLKESKGELWTTYINDYFIKSNEPYSEKDFLFLKKKGVGPFVFTEYIDGSLSGNLLVREIVESVFTYEYDSNDLRTCNNMDMRFNTKEILLYLSSNPDYYYVQRDIENTISTGKYIQISDKETFQEIEMYNDLVLISYSVGLFVDGHRILDMITFNKDGTIKVRVLPEFSYNRAKMYICYPQSNIIRMLVNVYNKIIADYYLYEDYIYTLGPFIRRQCPSVEIFLYNKRDKKIVSYYADIDGEEYYGSINLKKFMSLITNCYEENGYSPEYHFSDDMEFIEDFNRIYLYKNH